MRKKWKKKGGEEAESAGENLNYTSKLTKKLVEISIAEVSEHEEEDKGSSSNFEPIQMPAELSPTKGYKK